MHLRNNKQATNQAAADTDPAGSSRDNDTAAPPKSRRPNYWRGKEEMKRKFQIHFAGLHKYQRNMSDVLAIEFCKEICRIVICCETSEEYNKEKEIDDHLLLAVYVSMRYIFSLVYSY